MIFSQGHWTTRQDHPSGDENVARCPTFPLFCHVNHVCHPRKKKKYFLNSQNISDGCGRNNVRDRDRVVVAVAACNGARCWWHGGSDLAELERGQ